MVFFPEKKNYISNQVEDQNSKLFAIVKALKTWQYYLKYFNHYILVLQMTIIFIDFLF